MRRTSRTFIQEAIARGYRPVTEPVASVRFVTGSRPGQEFGVAAILASLPVNTLFVLCPTYLGKCSQSEHRARIEQVLQQLGRAARSRPTLGLVLFVGMQWLCSNEADNEQAAVERLRALAWVAEQHPCVSFIGLALRGPGKNRTINAALRATIGARPRGWLWIDDDIRLENGCLEMLIDRFLAEPSRGAVGATIVPVQDRYTSSRWLHRVGKLTAPLKAFPTAGCMIVDPRVLRDAIPARCFVDDAFVLFELLDPSREDPFEALEVVPGARAQHHVSGVRVRENRLGAPAGSRHAAGPLGGRGSVTLAQLRRRLYAHVIYAAEYPADVARCYLSSCLFFGLWPLSDWDRSLGPGRTVLRWAIKAVHLSLFLAVAANLFIRGMVDRPIHSIRWGSNDKYWRLISG